MSAFTNRREFLEALTAGAAATALTTQTARAAQGPNDKLVVGLIGCGNRGIHDAGLFKSMPNVELAYVCDVDESRRQNAMQKLGIEPRRAVSDMRKIFDDKTVDAVVIATPDHWHSPAAILAVNAGKHVYVEKPISHNIREGRLLVEAAERNKRLVQHGTQVRSTSTMIEAVKLLRAGTIGDVLVAKCWNIQRRRGIGHEKPGAPPTGLDYDTWIGPAPLVAY